MQLSGKYDPSAVEEKWYEYWTKNQFFHAEPDSDKEPYCIVIPPPNVTGVLHMGHMLNSTVQDVLIRRARLQGRQACWVPGTDHASIATEARVVAMLSERGIAKSTLSREEFLHYAWEWKKKYGGKILEQLRKLGASCDWARNTFTMDPAYSRAVIRVFVDLFRKGCVYRDFKMINWDVEAQTALSNEEVVYAEEGEHSTLYTIRYRFENSPDEHILVATQRPETIMGDVAIAVNPDDERYRSLIGRTVLVPFIDRKIPIIADAYVDSAFGTGCLKVTPAHDVNDYEIGLRHGLPIIDTLDARGVLTAVCGVTKFVGKDRFEARKEIVYDLRQAGHLASEQEFTTRVGRSERTRTVVEPRLSLQWFLDMKKLAGPALRAVEQNEIEFYPVKFKNVYKHWMQNIRDWCISRQLWWGHRIPAYFYGEGKDDFVVAETAALAAQLASERLKRAISEQDLRQDPDALDTWMSSWLWPMAVFGGFEDGVFDPAAGAVHPAPHSELRYFYPTRVLVTAPEIIFFWVARMIMAGYEYMGEKPFEKVYFTGLVKDKERRKMSKSLGNSPDPLDLIAVYGADGVRTGLLFCSPAGNDLLFDEKMCEQGRNFSNKIWNAFRLVKGWQSANIDTPEENEVAMAWFEARLGSCILELEEHFDRFRLSEALMLLYRTIWDDFCARYLEAVKPTAKRIDETTLKRSTAFFETILRLLHPFMPFITEELWHTLAERGEKDSIMKSDWPTAPPVDRALIVQGDLAFEVVAGVRNLRKTHNIPQKKPVALAMRLADQPSVERFLPMICKMAHIDSVQLVDIPSHVGASFIAQTIECAVPIGEHIDRDKERAVLRVEIEYMEGFLQSVRKKLDNPSFIAHAPQAVVETEQKKGHDAERTLETLHRNLSQLEG